MIETKEYIDSLFTFDDAEVREMELAIWKKHILSLEPLDKKEKIAFFRREREKILQLCGKDLFTTWLVLFDGINESYLEKLWMCRNLYTKDDFQGWYWVVFKRHWYVEERLKECDDYFKYKGIANAFKGYIIGADDEILIRLICTKEEFESQARWIGTKADAVRFAKHFSISPKRMNKTFSISLNAKNLGKDLWKDKDRSGVLTILDRFN